MDETQMGRGEVLFVKALEQVQGDERDTILFSIAFSKQANGKIPTNFGPVSNSGGERRLNVAVTRARRKNVVFCSFEPGELDVSGSMYTGPKDLKEFLTFAKASGAIERGETVDRLAIRDRHRDDVAAALRTAGLHVMSDVGLSNFRLDLVLARPESPERPILPVLLDGESWRRRSTVSDRDVLPVEVLENLMGWPTVARIWWPMWLQNRQEVIDRVLAEVERAEAALAGATVERAGDFGFGSVRTGEPVSAESAADTADGPHISLHASSASTPETDPLPLDMPGRGRPATTSPPSLESDPPAPSAIPITTAAPVASEPDVPEPAPGEGAPLASTPVPVAPGDRHGATPDLDLAPEFAPALTRVVGSRDVLDALPNRNAAATVREQLLDVIDAEGPVELARLTRIVARRFGLNTVRAARADDIARLVPKGQMRKSRLGTFVWPTGLDPATWTGFRTVDPDGSRTLDEVAPEEISNAMRAVIARRPNMDDDGVIRLTAELFGIVRLGANLRVRLETVFKSLRTGRDAT